MPEQPYDALQHAAANEYQRNARRPSNCCSLCAQKDQQITKLTTERDTAIGLYTHEREMNQDVRALKGLAERELTTLRTEQAKRTPYLQHTDGCHIGKASGSTGRVFGCTCGLSTLIATETP